MESVASVNETTELIDKAYSVGMIQIREEITGFVDFLKTRRLRNVLEIGTQFGGTFYLWCRLSAMGGLKVSIDLPCPSEWKDRYGGLAELENREERFGAFAPRVKVITGDSHSSLIQNRVYDILAGEKLDFLFIDGDHSYEGVRQDYGMYCEFVGDGGIIAFHDIQHLGPERLWRELKDWQPAFTEMREFNAHQHWAGIGVIQL